MSPAKNVNIYMQIVVIRQADCGKQLVCQVNHF